MTPPKPLGPSSLPAVRREELVAELDMRISLRGSGCPMRQVWINEAPLDCLAFMALLDGGGLPQYATLRKTCIYSVNDLCVHGSAHELYTTGIKVSKIQ